MTVCVKCGYRNTPDKNISCNYCGIRFEVASPMVSDLKDDKLIGILRKYGHNVVKAVGDEGDGHHYIELDRQTFDTYMEDFSVELSEIRSTCGYRVEGIDVNSANNVRIWFKNAM